MRAIPVLSMVMLVAACAGQTRSTSPLSATYVESGQINRQPSGALPASYIIGPADVVSVSVFQVPSLSAPQVRVDAEGQIQLPLIGDVMAAGQTPTALGAELERRLGERYLRNPRVSVAIVEAASQKVTVDGSVVKPGVYEMQGRTTLLQAVAMAEGPSPTANLRSVAVFRTVNGERLVAVFDLASIRAGDAEDPTINGDDTIVVDTSRVNSILRNVVTALPALGVFARY